MTQVICLTLINTSGQGLPGFKSDPEGLRGGLFFKCSDAASTRCKVCGTLPCEIVCWSQVTSWLVWCWVCALSLQVILHKRCRVRIPTVCERVNHYYAGERRCMGQMSAVSAIAVHCTALHSSSSRCISTSDCIFQVKPCKQEFDASNKACMLPKQSIRQCQRCHCQGRDAPARVHGPMPGFYTSTSAGPSTWGWQQQQPAACSMPLPDVPASKNTWSHGHTGLGGHKQSTHASSSRAHAASVAAFSVCNKAAYDFAALRNIQSIADGSKSSLTCPMLHG